MLANVPDVCMAGRPVVFSIVARDAIGNARVEGGDKFAVRVTGTATLDAAVSDSGNGTYEASFVAPVTGSYDVAVTLAGTHVLGSPFRCGVTGAFPSLQVGVFFLLRLMVCE
jgi:hypothetical protein